MGVMMRMFPTKATILHTVSKSFSQTRSNYARPQASILRGSRALAQGVGCIGCRCTPQDKQPRFFSSLKIVHEVPLASIYHDETTFATLLSHHQGRFPRFTSCPPSKFKSQLTVLTLFLRSQNAPKSKFSGVRPGGLPFRFRSQGLKPFSCHHNQFSFVYDFGHGLGQCFQRQLCTGCGK